MADNVPDKRLATPAAPVGPVGPDAPVGPVAPVAPVGPVGPVAPVAPVAPVGPVAPVAPVEPDELTRHVTLAVLAKFAVILDVDAGFNDVIVTCVYGALAPVQHCTIAWLTDVRLRAVVFTASDVTAPTEVAVAFDVVADVGTQISLD